MIHHFALAVKDVTSAHEFYTKAMGFRLVKVVKRLAPTGGWTKHIFYDIGDGTFFAIWDLRGLEGGVLEADDWRGGLSTGSGLPWWVNHIAFDCTDAKTLESYKERWLNCGYDVTEIEHEFIHSIYARDPDGTLVEWTYNTKVLDESDRIEAERLLADDAPTTEEEYPSRVFKSPDRIRPRRTDVSSV